MIHPGNRAADIWPLVVPYTRGRGLDLGCGPFKPFPHMIGLDNMSGLPDDLEMAPGVLVCDCRQLPMWADGCMDYVFSSFLIDRLDDIVPVLREWWRVIRPNGHLVLYMPHKVADDVKAAMATMKSGWTIVDDGPGTRHAFLVYQKRNDGQQRVEPWRRTAKSLLIIRYGAIGDMIMMQTVLPGLKKEGWHITVNCYDVGKEILQHHECVDGFLLQDRDQVPNPLLNQYWTALASRYDRVINLSEVVEGSLLPTFHSPLFRFSKAARHRLCDVNYLEMHHIMAGLPLGDYDTRVRLTDDEQRHAAKVRAQLGGRAPLIVWSLGGSSTHKTWPWSHVLACYLADHSTCSVVFVGGRDERQLEIMIAHGYLDQHGYDQAKRTAIEQKGGLHALAKACQEANPLKHTRFFFRCGDLSVRESIALARNADLVFGPETGILNAVGLEAGVGKVIMLSHSTEENLTKYWKDTTVLTGDVPCYPCHQMHFQPTISCPNNAATSAAECASEIAPDRAMKAIAERLGLANAPRGTVMAA